MNQIFMNWDDAIHLINATSLTNAYGALCLIHQGVQSCSGSPVKSITHVRLPAYPLDLLWFYRNVECCITNWKVIFEKGVSNSSEIEDILNSSFLPELDHENQIALRQFASFLIGTPRTILVDDSFCCWLFAETILAPGFLSQTLNGSLSKNVLKQKNADFDTWAKMWT